MDQQERPDLTNGGLVCVMLGEGGDMPSEFGYHGQVLAIQGHRLMPNEVDNAIPHNTKAFIFGHGDRLPRSVFDITRNILTRRRIPYQTKEKVEQVASALRDILPKSKLPVETVAAADEPPTRERGFLRAFVEKHAPALYEKERTLTHAEAGRKLFEIAKREGIVTTLGSITQAERVWHNETRRTGTPTSAKPENVRVRHALMEAVVTVGKVKEQLEECLAYMQALETKNERLEKQIAKAMNVFDAFKGEMFEKG